MNKYIKKCLIVYTSLALILVGMAGAAYAITASDADQYITRSQYATDMAYLQNALDEQEAGLMGDINRYRTTDILFTTWDTPDLQSLGTAGYQGYHTGGNIYPKRAYSNTNWGYASGLASDQNLAVNPYHVPLYIHRLWNGDYYISNYIWFRNVVDTSTSGVYYTGFMKCAVPVENYPGWYLVLNTMQSASWTYWWGSLAKLDPSVPYPNSSTLATMKASNLRIRFKKDLWVQAWSGHPMPTSSTPVNSSSTHSYFNQTAYQAFMSSFDSSMSASGTETLYYSSWIDDETGDYMMTIRNINPCAPGSQARHYQFNINNAAFVLGGLIPRDNVEYLMGPLHYYSQKEGGKTSGLNQEPMFPAIDYIGQSQYAADAFDVEIVDGVNGIKYWHVYKRPRTTKHTGNYINTVFGWHYSIPIVY